MTLAERIPGELTTMVTNLFIDDHIAITKTYRINLVFEGTIKDSRRQGEASIPMVSALGPKISKPSINECAV
jgi:hypothetical protein